MDTRRELDRLARMDGRERDRRVDRYSRGELVDVVRELLAQRYGEPRRSARRRP